MELIKFKDRVYPKFQSEWFAAKYAFPFASEYCRGVGFDVGCNRTEWAYPGSIPIDLLFNNGRYHAMNLPLLLDGADYIFSSHCLEHLHDWVDVLEYWHSQLKVGGFVFLYLPDFSQSYWRPWHNKKHKNIFMPEIFEDYAIDNDHLWSDSFLVSGVDLNNSFCVVLEKR